MSQKQIKTVAINGYWHACIGKAFVNTGVEFVRGKLFDYVKHAALLEDLRKRTEERINTHYRCPQSSR